MPEQNPNAPPAGDLPAAAVPLSSHEVALHQQGTVPLNAQTSSQQVPAIESQNSDQPRVSKKKPNDQIKNRKGAGKNEVGHIRDRAFTSEEEMIYTSAEKGCCYMNLWRILWCGCCEPYQKITTRYVEETSWKSCGQKTESIAFENVLDVSREQSCLCSCLSFLPCCCCIKDMGDIVLYGSDESEKREHGDEKNRFTLDRVAHSFRVFETITAHLQRTHKTWRKAGRVVGRKLVQIEHI